MKKIVRYFLACVIILIIVSCVSVACLPWILSSSWGQKEAVSLINSFIPGKIEIKDLQLQWCSGQSFHGFELKDPEGKPIVTIENGTTEASLWQLLLEKTISGSSKIDNLNIQIETHANGKTNLQNALGLHLNEPLSFSSPISISQAFLRADFFSNTSSLFVEAHGKSAQGDLLGSFDIHLNIPHFLRSDFSEDNPQFFLNLANNPETLLEASVINFPISLLDQLIQITSKKSENILEQTLGDRLSLSLQKQSSNSGLAFALSLSTPKITSQLDALIKEDQNHNLITCNISGLFPSTNGRFSISFDSLAHSFSQIKTALSDIKENSHIILSFSQIPLDLFPSFKSSPYLNTLLGSSLDGTLVVTPLLKNNFEVDIECKTPNLSFEQTKFHINESIHLVSESQVLFQLSPDTLHRLFENEVLMLDTQTPLHILLRSFDLPLHNPQDLKTELTVSIPTLQLPKLHSFGITWLDQFTIDIKADSIHAFQTDLKGKLSLLTEKEKPSPILPEALNCFLHAEWDIEHDLLLKRSEILIKNSVAEFQADLSGSLQHGLRLNKPLQLEYLFTPDAITYINQQFKSNLPQLKEPAFVSCKIEQQEINIASLMNKEIQLNGALIAKQIIFQSPYGLLPTLEDTIIHWTIDLPQRLISLSLKSSIVEKIEDNKTTPLALNIQMCVPPSPHLDFSKANYELKANVTNMPTSFLAIFPEMTDISPFFGNTFDVNFKMFFDPTNNKPGYFDLITDSENFHLRGRFRIDERITIFETEKLPQIRLTLTPAGYQFLKDKLGFEDKKELKEAVILSAIFTQFDLPVDLSKGNIGHFKLELTSNEISWTHRLSKPFLFSGSISSDNINDHLKVSLQAAGRNALLFDATVNHFSNLSNLNDIAYDIKLQGKDLKPDFFRDLLPINEEQTEKIEALFGEHVSFNVEANLKQLKGGVLISAEGPHAHFSCDGTVNKGIFTLNQPITGSIDMTPRFSQAYFSVNVPLLNSVLKGEDPITLRVEKEGFSCPLIPFKMEDVKIAKATLQLGKLQFLNSGDLRAVLNLIHPVKESNIVIWFTPIYMEQNKGILSIKRFDMLVAGTYTLADWGKINLLTHESEFILGVSAKTLNYAFGITGVGNNYVLQIPLKVSKGKVKIDQKKVATKVSALIAQTQGGTTGKILGNVLDIVTSEKGDAYPSPTTTPFPWEDKKASLK